MHTWTQRIWLLGVLGACGAAALWIGCWATDKGGSGAGTATILNVSYDPTREFYKEYNETFARHWQEQTGQSVSIRMSHAGSGKQARSVIEGLPAAVVTLALGYDIDAIHRHAGLLPTDWQQRLPHNSCPYTSTIVFVVRKENQGIRDWDDLVKPGVEVITPNPETSGGARWNYLAAWGYALKRELGDFAKLKDPQHSAAVEQAQQKARQFVTELFRHVPVLDTGARDATMTFVRGTGDVLLAWENEALLVVNEMGPEKFKIVVPSVSIRAEPPVSLVDKVVDKQGTRQVAQAYLEYLYSAEGQTLAAKHYYRPISPELVPKELLDRFPPIERFTVDEVFGGWQKAQPEHFDEGGIFGQISEAIAK